MIVGFALALATLILRAATVNRHVRGRLAASALIFAVYALIGAVLAYAPAERLTPAMEGQLRQLLPLLFAFAAINAAIALTLNPFRIDRLPDRFPTIVQDTIVIAMFAVAAVIVLQERVLATTAVGAVVIGFALQDTLGNLFAGLAIQIEKPFRVGHWVRVAGTDGAVSEITWRATKLRTKDGNFVVVPNSVLSKDTIVNYSEPTTETRIRVDVGVSYDAPPATVKAVILQAIRDEPLISSTRGAEVLLVDFAASAVTYRIHLWTSDYGADEVLIDRVRTVVYYALKRAGIAIPYPIQVEMSAAEAVAPPADPAVADAALKRVAIFETLTDEQRAQLARAARPQLFGEGEVIVRQGDAGSSMFVLVSGDAAVRLQPSNEEVARVPPGGFFGEMSLLTGAPRTASVVAIRDTEVLEITANAFREFVMADPGAVDKIALAVSSRQAELDARRATGAPSGFEAPQSLLTRIRRFLRVAGVH
jgi:small-conductance mechanosensitive channel/CRP-like cAMP-binding protein